MSASGTKDGTLIVKTEDALEGAAKKTKGQLANLDTVRRGDKLLTEELEELKELRKLGVRIEWDTTASRKLLYKRNRLFPEDPNSFERNRKRINALFSLDELGNPVIFLRKDATRIEFLEEYKHFKQYLKWAKGRSKGESVENRIKAWIEYLNKTGSQNTEVKLELEAAEYIWKWLQTNGGTPVEKEVIFRRLVKWQKKFDACQRSKRQ
ncbi:hypothetical protein [Gimesia fumaroli]|uniref:Uncharacterized protein n=1 Tax=Gimesia fumaroli TaxID=2527976 RepID=A0A518IGH2_9PLAN|nr:hypothetical protein [Gimesia fumaroli]QDV52184.1 hypothetical protein Enr17x_42440 [Gimesia fumaroli]